MVNSDSLVELLTNKMIITPYSWFLEEKDGEKYDFFDDDPESRLWISFTYFDTRDSVHFNSPSAVQSKLRSRVLTDPKDHPSEKVVYRYTFSVLNMTKIDDTTYSAEIMQNATMPSLEALLNLKYLDDYRGPKTKVILDKIFLSIHTPE